MPCGSFAVPPHEKLPFGKNCIPSGAQETINAYHNFLQRKLRHFQAAQILPPANLDVLVTCQGDYAVEAVPLVCRSPVLQGFENRLPECPAIEIEDAGQIVNIIDILHAAGQFQTLK